MSAPMNIHLVRVSQDVDVVNVRCKPAKLGERPAFFPAHVYLHSWHDGS